MKTMRPAVTSLVGSAVAGVLLAGCAAAQAGGPTWSTQLSPEPLPTIVVPTTSPDAAQMDFQNKAGATIEKVAKVLGISTDNFVLDSANQRIVGYYTTTSQRDVMKQEGIAAFKVQYSAEQLQEMQERLYDRIPASATGVHWAGGNVSTQKVEVGATKEFFASEDWATASAGIPVSMKVEDPSQQPQPAAG